VQRCQLDQPRDLAFDPVVDQDRVAEPGASMDNPVPNCVRAFEALGRPRIVAFDEAQLQARRARIDD
jgi:hypothetical protein